MKKTKVIAVIACAVLLAIGSVAGTLAYLTSKTAPVTNTFTVGKVKISLDEAKVDVNGKPVNQEGTVVELAQAPRVTENSYHLMPGETYTKDPTIHFADGSVDSWIFVELINKISPIEDTDNTIESQLTANGWTKLDNPTAGVTDKNAVLYYKQVSENTSGKDIDMPLFGSFKISDTVSNLTGYTGDLVILKGYAIQQSGAYTDANSAWSALRGQMTP